MSVVGREAEVDALLKFLSAIPSGRASLRLRGRRAWARPSFGAGASQRRRAGPTPFSPRARPPRRPLCRSRRWVTCSAPSSTSSHRTSRFRSRAAPDVALLRTEAEGAPPDPLSVATATLSAIRLLAEHAPVVVAVDDRHWLDRATGDVLDFVRRRLVEEPVGFLETTRPESGTANPAEAQVGEGIDILDWSAVAGGAPRAGPGAVRPGVPPAHPDADPRDVGRDPFYALEIARLLVELDLRSEAGRPLPVPESLLGILRERIASLPAAVRRVLEAVATGSPGRVSERLQVATRAGVIELEGDLIRFTHPLLADVVRSGTAPAERRALHRRMADLVPSTEERARHLAQGGRSVR